ncbi:hypothetical protein CGLO_13546 [Colletotrichum gloeosporioides Cg-14]|jgi:hypothetical protein
MKSK